MFSLRSVFSRLASVALVLALFVPACLRADVSIDVAQKTVNRCDSDTYTVTVSNPGTETEDLTEMVVVVDLQGAGTKTFVTNTTTITVDHAAIPDQVLAGAAANPATGDNVILTWNLDTLFAGNVELAPGEEAAILFTVRYSCTACSCTPEVTLNGERARGTPIAEEDDLVGITLVPGFVTVKVSPTKQTISVDKLPEETLAEWTLEVENTGLGNIYNVIVTDVVGAGLIYENGSATIGTTTLAPGAPTGSTLVWDMAQFAADPDGAGGLADLDGDGKFDDLASGESIEITNVKAAINSCANLTNAADAQFRCFDGATYSKCYDTADEGTTGLGTIAVRIREPSIDLQFDPDGKLDDISYCDGVDDVRLVITNAAGAGQARNITVSAAKIPATFTLSNFDPPGVTYNGTTYQFENVPPVAGGTTQTITFDVDWGGGCGGGATEADLLIYPYYENVCGEHFHPPVSVDNISLGSRDRVSMDIAKEVVGNLRHVDVGATGVEFDLTATISGSFANVGTGLPATLTITDTYPERWTVTDAALGTVDPVARTITWSHEFKEATPTFTKRVTFDVTGDPCDAGTVVQNTLSVPSISLTDCLACSYTIGGETSSVGIFINQDDAVDDPFDDVEKSVTYLGTQTGAVGEACRNLQFAIEYDFSVDAPASWAGIFLRERLVLQQDFVSLDSVVWDPDGAGALPAVDYGPSGTTPLITAADVTNESTRNLVDAALYQWTQTTPSLRSADYRWTLARESVRNAAYEWTQSSPSIRDATYDMDARGHRYRQRFIGVASEQSRTGQWCRELRLDAHGGPKPAQCRQPMDGKSSQHAEYPDDGVYLVHHRGRQRVPVGPSDHRAARGLGEWHADDETDGCSGPPGWRVGLAQ